MHMKDKRIQMNQTGHNNRNNCILDAEPERKKCVMKFTASDSFRILDLSTSLSSS